MPNIYHREEEGGCSVNCDWGGTHCIFLGKSILQLLKINSGLGISRIVPGPFCQVSSVALQLGREIWRRVLCGITGLCIADKRSQHLANFQQIDGKTLSSIDGKTLSSIDEMTLSSSCWRL